MSIKTLRSPALVIGAAVAATIAGCGGSDHQPKSVFIPPQSLTGGIWRGTEINTGAEVFAIVTEDGDFALVMGADLESGSEVMYSGALESAAGGGINFVEGSFVAASVAGSGAEVCAGQPAAVGVITNGDVSQRRSLQLDSVLGLPCATPLPTRNFDLAYDSAYERTANINTPAGNYTDSATGAAVTINDGGGIFSQDPVSGCVITGRITPVDQNFNAYSIEYAIEACADPAFNGAATGFATMNGRSLVSLASLSTSVGTAGLVQVLDRN